MVELNIEELTMKIEMVCVEDGLANLGFRKMAAFVLQENPDTTIRYIAYDNRLSMSALIQGRYGTCSEVPDEQLLAMAKPLAEADIVCFSSMTGYAEVTRGVMEHLRRLNPDIYIIWGGIHPIVDPDDAIQAPVDAICTGEGEFAFKYFLDRFKDGRDYTDTGNFWFKQKNGEVVKNPFLPLMTNEDLDTLPLLHYGENELIYQNKYKTLEYKPIGTTEYAQFNGLSYNTIWSIGCPFKCSYCGNTRFIENDPGYRKIRYSSVQHIIDEVLHAKKVHPHINTVVFHDDSFMALPIRVLKEFADAWKEHVGLAFFVVGVMPNYVKEDKFAILVEAGMNRVRMGIQNGSWDILQFYKRPTPPERVLEAAEVIAKFKGYMIPPNYDIILDNPIETEEDVRTNLRFLHKLARPYTLNIFSLRVIPNTVLARQMEARNVSIDSISANFVSVTPTLANCLVFLLSVAPLSDWFFKRMLEKSHPVLSEPKLYPRLLILCRFLYLCRRAVDHLRFMDFSTIVGRSGLILWKLGVIDFWQKHFIPKFKGKYH